MRRESEGLWMWETLRLASVWMMFNASAFLLLVKVTYSETPALTPLPWTLQLPGYINHWCFCKVLVRSYISMRPIMCDIEKGLKTLNQSKHCHLNQFMIICLYHSWLARILPPSVWSNKVHYGLHETWGCLHAFLFNRGIIKHHVNTTINFSMKTMLRHRGGSTMADLTQNTQANSHRMHSRLFV